MHNTLHGAYPIPCPRSARYGCQYLCSMAQIPEVRDEILKAPRCRHQSYVESRHPERSKRINDGVSTAEMVHC